MRLAEIGVSMQVGLYQAISGMKAMWDNQQVIAEDLATSSIPGNRSVKTAFEIDTPKDEQIIHMGEAGEFSITSVPVGMTRWVDFAQGSIRPTEIPTHFAIQGESFFTLQDSEGNTTYTRNGQFNTTSEGEVIANDGSTVLLEGGSPLRVEDVSVLTVSQDGTVFEGATRLGKLALVHFNNPEEDLLPAEGGRFRLAEGREAEQGLPPGDRVAQGFLEQSNAEPVDLMVRMIEVMRAYEANQKMVSAQDDSTAKLIQTVGS